MTHAPKPVPGCTRRTDEGDLSLFNAGLLGDDEATKILAHLEECDACASRSIELGYSMRLVADVARSQALPRRSIRRWRRVSVAAGIIVALGAGALWVVGKRGDAFSGYETARLASPIAISRHEVHTAAARAGAEDAVELLYPRGVITKTPTSVWAYVASPLSGARARVTPALGGTPLAEAAIPETTGGSVTLHISAAFEDHVKYRVEVLDREGVVRAEVEFSIVPAANQQQIDERTIDAIEAPEPVRELLLAEYRLDRDSPSEAAAIALDLAARHQRSQEPVRVLLAALRKLNLEGGAAWGHWATEYRDPTR